MNKSMGVAALLLVSGGAQAGIEISLPLASGDLTTFENGRETAHRSLSTPQLQAMSNWLRMHRSGWHGMITEASPEQPLLCIGVKDEHGEAGDVVVYAAANGGYSLQFRSSSRKPHTS